MTTLVTITLNSPIAAAVGPNLALTADVGVVVPSTATITELLAGLIVEVDVLATTITLTSSGQCTNVIPLTISTTTTSTTANPCPGLGLPSLTLNENLNLIISPFTIFPFSYTQIDACSAATTFNGLSGANYVLAGSIYQSLGGVGDPVYLDGGCLLLQYDGYYLNTAGDYIYHVVNGIILSINLYTDIC